MLWEKFGGREETLRAPAKLVRRVRTLIIAQNEYDAEQLKEQREKQAELERKRQSEANRR